MKEKEVMRWHQDTYMLDVMAWGSSICPYSTVQSKQAYRCPEPHPDVYTARCPAKLPIPEVDSISDVSRVCVKEW